MSLSEIVRGIAGLYHTHQEDNISYNLFIDKARQVAQSSLDMHVNAVYKELSEIGTKPLLAPYLHNKVPRKQAAAYVQDILQYTEFFIKYKMLLPRIENQDIKKRFESVFDQTISIDEVIARYNQEIAQLGVSTLRPYLVAQKQPYDSIVGRGKKDIATAKTRQKSKYGLPNLTKMTSLI